MAQINVLQFCKSKRVEIGLVAVVGILLLVLVVGWYR